MRWIVASIDRSLVGRNLVVALHLRSLVRIFLCADFLFALPIYFPSVAAENYPAQAIVYYSNSTITAAPLTENWSRLLSILDASPARSAGEIRRALLDDAASSSGVFNRDVAAISNLAHRIGVGFFAFSNELALRNNFLEMDRIDGSLETRELSFVLSDDNLLLAHSPLSRSEYLSESLAEVSKYLGSKKSRMILIVHSHGSQGMALMPRVNIDTTHIAPTVLNSMLSGVNHDDLALANLSLQGTTQSQFWRAVAAAARNHDIEFNFVFLSSCEGGAVTFSDAMAVPLSVKFIGHTAKYGMSSEMIDYDGMLTTVPIGTFDQLVDRLLSALPAQVGQNIYIDTPFTMFRWPTLALFRNKAAVGIAVTPFFLWCFLSIRRFRGAR